MANLEGYLSDAAPSKQKPRVTAMLHAIDKNGDLPSGHGLMKHRKIPQRILQSALAAVIGPLLLEEDRCTSEATPWP
jgi:hypothetical protein